MEVESAAGGVSLAGRRRITQLSKEEWREALQQQLREKEQRKQADAGAKRSTCHSSNQQDQYVESPLPSVAQQRHHGEEGVSVNSDIHVIRPGGRRFVRAMTAEEWRASLEAQIREKELLRHTRSQTAPSDAHTTEKTASERVITTANECGANSASFPPLSDDPVRVIGRRRRGVQTQQTREEYLRGLQEQIELKKQQQFQEETNVRKRRGTKPRYEDADTDGLCLPPASFVPEAKTASPAPAEQPLFDARDDDTNRVVRVDSEIKSIETSVKVQTPATTPETPFTVDPTMLSKLFELCEGMKQQNEELKQQLREQKSVLATLTEKTPEGQPLVTKINAPCEVPRKQSAQSSKASAASSKGVDHKSMSTKQATSNMTSLPGIDRQGRKSESPTRPPIRAAADIGSSTLSRSGLERAVSESPAEQISGENSRSRLLQPRFIPRLRPTGTINSNSRATTVPTDAAIHDSKSEIPESEIETNTTDDIASAMDTKTIGTKKTAARTVQNHGDKQSSTHQRLPILQLSPPVEPQNPERLAPLPPLGAKPRTPAATLDTDDCLDGSSSTRTTLIHRVDNSAADPPDLDLEARSSSVAVLVALSSMISCEKAVPQLFRC